MSCHRQIKDNQISTMLNAIFFNGMSFDETYWLTIAMKNSGFTLKTIPRTIDKHSKVGGQAVLGRQGRESTPWLTERHGQEQKLHGAVARLGGGRREWCRT